MTKHINDLIASRRALLGGLAGLPLLELGSCASAAASSEIASTAANFAPVAETNADTVSLPAGYQWRKLIAWGDALFEGMNTAPDLDAMTRAEQERRFGNSNDMLALFPAAYSFPPSKTQTRMILCANNEYMPLELSYPALRRPADLTPVQGEALYASVGVSIVDLQRGGAGWRALRNRAPGQGHNRRITPFSPVQFSGPAARHPWILAAADVVNAAEPPRGVSAAPGAIRCGTVANCAGGLTPWGTYLTAEENLESFFVGSLSVARQFEEPALALDASSFGYPSGWPMRDKAPAQFDVGGNPHGPALYGWIVEIDPYDPASTPKKRTALGRKKNECATTALTRDGRVVVYMGDDQRDEHIYKFVSRGRFDPANRPPNMDLLDDGQLYVAQFDEAGGGRWVAIELTAANAAAAEVGSPIRFRDEADLLVRVRYAAMLLGATPMDRPEDVEALRDDAWRGLGPVLIACTNNSERGFARPGNPRRESEAPDSAQSNLPGHIVRIDEDGGDSGALTFTWDVFAMGGDPDADARAGRVRSGARAQLSTAINGQKTISGDRFACPDNMFIDSTQRVWIATDGNDGVFGACNDGVLVAPLNAEGPRPIKRFMVCPVGAEVCGPLMTPDERAFFCSIQHPGGSTVDGSDYSQLRWQESGKPPSSFPDGGDAWPRSAVIVITRDDGGRIGD